MARLNAQYRGKQGPTDVLSFANHDGLSAPEAFEARLLAGRLASVRAGVATSTGAAASLDAATRADVAAALAATSNEGKKKRLTSARKAQGDEGQTIAGSGQEGKKAEEGQEGADPPAAAADDAELAGERDLGDIIIAAPYVTRYCAQHSLSLPAHYCRLLAHGLTHLLGHDHETEEEHAAMAAREEPIHEHLVRQLREGVLPEWTPGRR